MDRDIARPHGACKGCGRRFTHKLYLVWGYCPACSPAPLVKPLDGDSYDDARAYDEQGGEA